MKYASAHDFLNVLTGHYPHHPEYLQAVAEVVNRVWPFMAVHPRYAEAGLLERLVEPERAILFRIAWVDDRGEVQVNRGYRIQHSAALGPYKGGLRFHPTVNLSVLRFLAFEQTFKNALTTLPLGGGKGGADFDPKGRSDGEVMRFCQAMMTELYRHLGADTDVPAGDIGVGAREIGYLVGMMKKLGNRADGVFTGKDPAIGGSWVRREATGYGLVYFAEQMLGQRGLAFEGLRVSVSGAGNVAQHAIAKAMARGATVVTASDSTGTVVDEQGFTPAKLAELQEVKNLRREGLEAYARRIPGAVFLPGCKPWQVPVAVALPCATQNELDAGDARALLAHGVRCIAEGANMPCTPDAVALFEDAGVLYAPGKASNAGGVAVSGLEMSQNAQRLAWAPDEVDARLHAIMAAIHATCLQYGRRADGSVSYVDGANIAGFVRVAEAMLAQGVV